MERGLRPFLPSHAQDYPVPDHAGYGPGRRGGRDRNRHDREPGSPAHGWEGRAVDPSPLSERPMQPRLLVAAALIGSLACSRGRPDPDSGANAGSAATPTPASGAGGTYSAANGDPVSLEFKSGGKVELNGGPLG